MKDLIQNSRTIALFSFGGVIIAAFLPWAKIWILTKAGTDGDGVITLLLGAVGAAAIWIAANKGALLAAACALLALSVGVYDVIDVSSTARASVGIGLWLTVLASGIAALASVLRWRQLKEQTMPPDAVTAGSQQTSTSAGSDDPPPRIEQDASDQT
jgi:hypothetical protein